MSRLIRSVFRSAARLSQREEPHEGEMKFLETGDLIDDDLELQILQTCPPNPPLDRVPTYRFRMAQIRKNMTVGTIDLRVGSNSYIDLYLGNIGYNVLPRFRGQHYAARSCQLLLPFAARHDIPGLWITCNPDNIPSRKTCERVGGVLKSIIPVPENIDLYRVGDRFKCRYWIDLTPYRSA